MDNFYEPGTRAWVTDWDRYRAIAEEPRFAGLDNDVVAAPDRAWSSILALLAAIPDDAVHYLGAGPLESFVVRHAPAFVDAIEAEVRNSPRFRRAAREINLERGQLPSGVEARLVAAFGPGFQPLDPNAG